MDNKLILHIGMPKTGTTSLQNFMMQNENLLLEHGYCYPDIQHELETIGLGHIAQKSSVVPFNGDVFRTFRNCLKSLKNDTRWSALCNLIHQKLEKKHVIISSEGFWLWDNLVEYLSILKEEFPGLMVVVYLRRQDKYVESYYGQVVKKNELVTYEFEEFLEKYNFRDQLKYLQRLKAIIHLIGKDNLRVRRYDKAKFAEMTGRRDVLSDFFSLLGMEIDFRTCDRIQNLNSNLQGVQFDIKRTMNSVLTYGPVVKMLEKPVFESASIDSHSTVVSSESFFTKEKRLEYLKQYEEENDEIRKLFFSEDTELFRMEDLEKETRIHTNKLSENESEMIRIMGGMIKTLYDEVFILKKKVQMLTLKGNRKLAFIGAGNRCFELVNVYDLQPDAIWDNDCSKHGIKIGNNIVESVPMKEKCKEYMIVITPENPEEIGKQLEHMGLIKNTDYMAANEWLLDIYFA